MRLNFVRNAQTDTGALTAAALALTGLIPLLANHASAADWPGFRGPTATGTSMEKEVFPADGKFSLETVWKKKIGSGYSGIAVADGKVVTAFSDGTSDCVMAMDESTGDEIWRFTLDKTHEGHDGSHTGPIATPLIGDGHVFMLAPRGRLFALDLKTGKKKWSTDLVGDQGSTPPYYGFATSPLFHDSVLVVQVGGKDAAVAGFNPSTGKRLWKVGGDKVDYQSPVLTTLFGGTQVVAAGDKKLYGIDAKTGTTLWDYAHGGGGARGGGSLVPVPSDQNRLFLAHKDNQSTVVQLEKTGDDVTVKSLWENRNIRNSYNTPVYYDGYLYAFSSRFLTCVDASNGKSQWRSRDPGDGFTILVDGHLVILTKNGSVHVIRATPEGYEEQAGVSVFDDLAWAPPSFANGHILVRSHGEIARIAIRSGQASMASAKDVVPTDGHSEFARFLAEVTSATNKKDVIDQFMKTQKQFPIVESNMVHFVYRGKGEDVAVGSDLFGARQERDMQRIEGTDFFYVSSPMEPDARLNYIFIRDYEDHITDPLNPRKTTTTLFGKEMEMTFGQGTMEMSWFSMPQWKAPTYFDTPQSSQKGKVETKDFRSKLVGRPIKVDVYLPAGYQRSKQRYPVAYVHGGTDALKRGDFQKALDNLIGRNVAPIIVVFVKYTPPMFGPNKYPEMFVQELIPFIDKTYRTIDSPAGRASMGAGFAGSMAITSILKGANPVGKIGCLSPFLFGIPTDQIAEQFKKAKDRKLQVYMDWGKYDFRNPQEAWDMGKSAHDFAEMLREYGYHVSGGQLNEGTGWSSWRNRIQLVFSALFPKA